MADTLAFVYNGGTYSLSATGTALGGTVRLMSYTPQYGGDNAETIYEEATVELIGSSSGVIGTAINRINKILQSAKDWKNNKAREEAFIQFQPAGYGTAYRSPIIGGNVYHVEDKTFPTGYWNKNIVQFTVGWERHNYWEKCTEEIINVANSNLGTPFVIGTLGVGAGGTLFNTCSLAGTSPIVLDNSFVVIPSDLVGDLPSPIEFDVANNVGETTNFSKIYLSGHIFENFYGLNEYPAFVSNYFYEGENSSLGGTLSGTAYVDCSGSAYIVGTALAAETNLFQWSIGTAAAAVLRGDPYHIMARFVGTTGLADTKFRWKALVGTTAVWSGAQFRLATPGEIIQDMGVVNIPPQVKPQWSGTAGLLLTGQMATGTAGTISLDFIQLFSRNFAKLTGLNPLEANQWVEFGGRNYKIIRKISTITCVDWYTQGNRSLTIDPRYINFFNCLVQTTVGTVAEIDHEIMYKIKYHPRRRTL